MDEERRDKVLVIAHRTGFLYDVSGLNLDLCLFVPCFPAFFDLLISLDQGTQGNKGRKGISRA